MPTRAAAWTYFARRPADSRIMRISAAEAKRVIASGTQAENPRWLVVWEVPPKYAAEAAWRVKKGFIAPSWDYLRGPLPGGLYDDHGGIEKHTNVRTSKPTASLRYPAGVRLFRKDEDPIGQHVVWHYQGRELLGTVVAKRTTGGLNWLNVRYFNGDSWPDDPLRSEVGVLPRTFKNENENEARGTIRRSNKLTNHAAGKFAPQENGFSIFLSPPSSGYLHGALLGKRVGMGVVFYTTHARATVALQKLPPTTRANARVVPAVRQGDRVYIRRASSILAPRG